MSKIVSLPELLIKVGTFERDKTVVMCQGCFDIVHPGHIRHLAYAKSKACILVVALTADRLITKGTYRPHVPQQIRAETISAFEMVDYVIIDDNDDPQGLIKALMPNFFAKGFEYSDNHNPVTIAESQLVESYGGEMIFTPGDVVYSSSKLLNKHLPNIGIEKLISLMKQFKIEFDDIHDALLHFKDFKVHVVGDTIIDTYTRTNLIGSNAKTPTFSVQYYSDENYIGGAGVVAMHLKAAGADVTFTTIMGSDKMCDVALEQLLAADVQVNRFDAHRPTTHKNTIICGETRLVKIDTLDNSPIPEKLITKIAKDITSIKTDCVVFSDFRHGIFHKESIDTLSMAIPCNAFRVADSQVASRWGNITEFHEFDLITPNEKEARFALADQDSNIGRLITATKKAANCKNIIMKLGSKGAFFLNEDRPYSVDSFVDNVIDPVGAGDAFLAYATLTMLATKSLPMACIIGSIAAACECEIDGNLPVNPEQVLQKLQHLEGRV